MDLVGRVFLAISPPSEIRFALAERLAEIPVPGRVVPAENWHITLRFLDAVDSVTYERFLHALHPPSETSFRVALDGLGAFPGARRATVLWAGIGVGAEQLAVLNEDAEEAAIAAGLLPEERPFHPHLTLSRIRPPMDVREIVDEEVSLSWRCQRMITYRSNTVRGGVSYEPLDVIDLIG